MAQDHSKKNAESKKSAEENTEIQLSLEHQQLVLLYAAIPNSLLASLFGSVVATLIFIQVISPYRIYPWVVFLLIAFMPMVLMVYFLDSTNKCNFQS